MIVIAVLKLKEVSKKYKSQQVIDEINLTIDHPGIWALVGPNGVGKTTLLNCICNIIPASKGEIYLLGESNKNYQVFKQVSYLQDNTVLFHYLSGYDHLKFVCDIHKLSKSRIKEVAEYVGMDSYLHKKVGDYSLGMKQHLLLAISIVNRPKLLFMDEPLTGLDPSSAILMRNILLELVEQGTTVILSSHNLAEIDRVTNNIIFLKDGKLVEVDRLKHMETQYIFKLSDEDLGKRLFTDAGYTIQENSSNGMKVIMEESNLNQFIQNIQNSGISILDIQKEVSGSEELYETYFGKRG
ncbi:ABC transporter ATP-binding protein [Oceanobacillus iheyensis HTE831]|uniref:ABC transporter ATP-binding protein n=1 Tax=Oceanobacillus iheyensis (strain DSM 14371 / CIP 107618 / JCM 11309 / KCTC 3954 / HTE831) TaxID=221109 RepID=Q8ETI9_OCEIH|nr:ABC transporter ATP-binding protein [Oceanobacillus iheyensis]BAC12227.1 ABC transporter ATP-binding protein [Oceanobacillus iheyensis HTE831]